MEHPVYLRALEKTDIDRCHEWHNDKNTYNTLVGTFNFVSKAAEENWLNSKTSFSPDMMNLAICLKSTDQHIGNIYLSNIDWISRNANIAIFIGEEKERSKGYGKSAIIQLLDYAFNDLNLIKVYLKALEDNNRAIHTYERCGFIIEGRLKNHIFKNGEFKDLIIMGIFSNNFSS